MAAGDCTLVEQYPGSRLGAKEVFALADLFRDSAKHLSETGKARKTKTAAPFRLVTIHAIELYLNAYLLASGIEASAIRGMQHNLAKRAELVQRKGMVLRKRTKLHLEALSTNREYLGSRYDLPDAKTVSVSTQLTATMEYVRNRVIGKLEPEPTKLKPKAKPSVPDLVTATV